MCHAMHFKLISLFSKLVKRLVKVMNTKKSQTKVKAIQELFYFYSVV